MSSPTPPTPRGDDLRAQFNSWLEQNGAPDKPATPAATVVVLRDAKDGPEILMMRRNSTIAFGGAWVFPGGKVDPGDYSPEGPDDSLTASRHAAVREAHEEGAITIAEPDLVEYSHWLPPPIAPRRFSTWFFVARASGEEVVVDQGEITEFDWMRPSSALHRQSERTIELAPPTWVTLHNLAPFPSVEAILAQARSAVPRFYMTRVGRLGDDPVAMWEGDAGYTTSDPITPGARHRLTMARGGWFFEDSGIAS